MWEEEDMPEIAFFQQRRRDGGMRSGIEINGKVVRQTFEPGEEASDPFLLWYVDVRCKGAKLPTDLDGAFRFFRKHREMIQGALAELAERLEAGMDFELYPLQWPIPKPPKGVRMTLVCGANRRRVALDIAKELTRVADHWEEVLHALDEGQETVR
jgi:hypothetical protein